jgi:hypothetical protein
MAYYLDLFSPATYEAFRNSDQRISGFRVRQRIAAGRVKKGDKLICYLTKLGRWVALLEVIEGPFEQDKPIFYPTDDPFVVRFQVAPKVCLAPDRGIPIKEDFVWDRLTFTRGQDKSVSTWTGPIRASLARISDADGEFLEQALKSQVAGGRAYPVDETDYQRLVTHRVRRADKDIAVTVPEESRPEDSIAEEAPTIARESIKIQALLADLGSRMGLQTWIPRADRGGVLAEWPGKHEPILERLPLNYEETTLRTIEQIDVLWLKGRSIRRAFEVEHTTSVYSGLLRMADLLALQPNMDIRLHIVAPAARRDKVFQEIRRPVFSLLDRGPLSESCTYLTYESVRQLIAQPHLAHLSDDVLDEYEEAAEDD